jgi:hypothetical protein
VRATGGDVVDRAYLGQPLAVTFLTLGQAGRELGGRLGRGLGRGGPQRVGAHHDPLAVGGDHQHVVDVAGRWLAAGVEGVEVDHRGSGERFDLSFAQLLAGAPSDRVDGVVE